MERTLIGRILVLLSAVIFCLCWLGGVLAREVGQAGREVSFARDIRPILEARCLGCHNGSRMSGGLRLDRPAGVRRDSIIVPGRAAESRLYERITATGDEAMPPTGERLTAAQIGPPRHLTDHLALRPGAGTGSPVGVTRPKSMAGSRGAGGVSGREDRMEDAGLSLRRNAGAVILSAHCHVRMAGFQPDGDRLLGV